MDVLKNEFENSYCEKFKNITMKVNKTVAFAVVLCFSLCLLTLGQFILFLSSHTSLKYFYPAKYNSDHFKNASDESNQDSIFIPMVKNMAVVLIFVLQHSLLAKKRVKDFLVFLGVYERLFYNITSCLALQIVMYWWQSVPVWTAWEVSTHVTEPVWWIFSAIHAVAWLIIYGGCFIVDLPEFVGIKQVYNHAYNMPTPLAQKSDGLKRFYSHMRHPFFSALIVILFIHPVMQFDRLILAHALTIYMLINFKIDDIDYAYQRRELQRKYRDLNLSN